MIDMRWSWDEYEGTPADVVDGLVERMSERAEAKRQAQERSRGRR